MHIEVEGTWKKRKRRRIRNKSERELESQRKGCLSIAEGACGSP